MLCFSDKFYLKSKNYTREFWLEFLIKNEYNYNLIRGCSSAGEHHTRIVGVEGSNPFSSTIDKTTWVSQVVFLFFCVVLQPTGLRIADV